MTGMQLISSTKQREWTWPATANFVLGGAGAGFYLVSVLNMILGRGMSEMVHPVLFGMWAPVLMGLGFVFLTTETGRPLRSFYLFGRLGKAWISRETLAFTFFAPAVVLDHFFPHLIFKACAVLSALFFMVAQGFILYSCRALPAWNVSIMPLFFLSSGFASGAGLVMLLAASGKLVIEGNLVLLSITCIIWNLIVWLFYLRWSGTIDFRSAAEALRRPSMMFFIIVFGHGFPILMLLMLHLRAFSGMGGMFPAAFGLLSGLAIIIGVTAQKTGIVISSGYTRKITLP